MNYTETYSKVVPNLEHHKSTGPLVEVLVHNELVEAAVFVSIN